MINTTPDEQTPVKEPEPLVEPKKIYISELSNDEQKVLKSFNNAINCSDIKETYIDSIVQEIKLDNGLLLEIRITKPSK